MSAKSGVLEVCVICAVLVAAMPGAALATAPTSFLYQGRLLDDGAPASGLHDIRCALFAASAGGMPLGDVLCFDGLALDEGLFALSLDFGVSFDGGERFLELAVRADAVADNCATGGFTTLVPRQRLDPVPHAIYAHSGSATALHERPISSAAPAVGQQLEWTGAVWAPGLDEGLLGVAHDATLTGSGTSTLPLGVAVPLLLAGVTAEPVAIVNGTNSGGGSGVKGTHAPSGNKGHVGTAEEGVSGLYFESGNVGQLGAASAAVIGTAMTGDGVVANTSSVDGRGVAGWASAALSPTRGVWGRSDSTAGVGVYGWAAAGTGSTAGAFGISSSAGGVGLHGEQTASGNFGDVGGARFGVFGRGQPGADNVGVYGLAGVDPVALPFLAGVSGMSFDLRGTAGHSFQESGVYGRTETPGHFAGGPTGVIAGVRGDAAPVDAVDNFGVAGIAQGYGTGVVGIGSFKGHGVIGVPGNHEPSFGSAGVWGMTLETTDGPWPPRFPLEHDVNRMMVGVLGQAFARVGVWGESREKIGVVGTSGESVSFAMLPSGPDKVGVFGRCSLAGGAGVYGQAAVADPNSFGVFGTSAAGSSGGLGGTEAGVVGVGSTGVLGSGVTGVRGVSSNLAGVQGLNTNGIGAVGFLATTWAGVSGDRGGQSGLLATDTHGFYGQATGAGHFGGYAQHVPSGNDVQLAGEDVAVYAVGNPIALWGHTFDPNGVAVRATVGGTNPESRAVHATNAAGWAGYFEGKGLFTGALGVGRVPATYMLEVEGEASKTSPGGWLANSDVRFKTGIERLDGALDVVDRVRPVSFRFNAAYRDAHPSVSDRAFVGVIAQEFAQVFPDEVRSSGDPLPDGEPTLQVDIYPLTIYSVRAIQELRAQIEMQSQMIEDLRARLDAAEARLEERARVEPSASPR